MPRRRATVVDVVEAAYRAAVRSPTTWVAEVLAVAAPLLDRGADVVAYEYDTTRPMRQWLSPPVGNPELAASVVAAFADTPPGINHDVHRRLGPVTILSEILQAPLATRTDLAPHARPRAMADMLGVNATDPSGRGTYFCAPSRRVIRRNGGGIQRWEQVAAHIAAAGRLRHVLARPGLPEAILSPDGKVLHAASAAQSSLPMLQRAARASERARVERTDLDTLAAWSALVDGRWSLVDEIERDGRRILLAHANPAAVGDPRRLTRMERVVAGYVAMGHSNKLIGYELGVAPSTVALHLQGATRKLGVRSRVELVDRVLLISHGRSQQFEIGGELVNAIVSPESGSSARIATLTRAELAVARLAARGRSSAYIARERRVSVRTIANQLASIYAKLAIGTRSELAHLLAASPPTK
ncbi:MAG: helix-turn-helix transcriptional regulator [Myxococcales bacterium]|nr:helix-turn-helix transcriptional regulator [Myxococcales bacterium]